MCVVTGFANHAGTTPDGGLQVWVGASGFRVIQQGAAGPDALCLIGLYESLLNVFPHANNFCGIKVAQLHWKLNTAGDDIDRTGVDFHVSYSADLTTLFGPHHVAHCEHVL